MTHPLRAPGQPMRYRRDLPDADPDVIAETVEHVREHLAAVADPDDDPAGLLDEVTVGVFAHADGGVSVLGELDADPVAPYLDPGYNPAADDDGTTFHRYSEDGRE